MKEKVMIMIILFLAFVFLLFFHKRLSFSYIIHSQIESFYDFKNKKKDKLLCYMYFLLPLIISFLIVFSIGLNKNIFESIIVIFSIFIGLLFNLLLLIYDIFQKTNNKDKKKLLKEVYSSITFSILISVISLIITLGGKFDLSKVLNAKVLFYLSISAKILVCYTLLLFIINLFIILKRIHILIDSDFNAS